MTGVAVKVTGVPWQDGLALLDMETLTGRLGFTVIFTWFEKAGLPVAHEWLEVRRHVTTSPLVGVYI